jgi:hypothetical protein
MRYYDREGKPITPEEFRTARLEAKIVGFTRVGRYRV